MWLLVKVRPGVHIADMGLQRSPESSFVAEEPKGAGSELQGLLTEV